MRRMYSENQLLKGVESQAKLNGIKIFEDIIDKDGHPRSVEGAIALNSELTGLTLNYGKWSLSGSHLLFVVGGSIANTTAWSNTNHFTCTLPKWIYDKIAVLFSSANVDIKTITFYANDYTTQTLNFIMQKGLENRISIVPGSTITANKDRNFRIAFDLLIDNE